MLFSMPFALARPGARSRRRHLAPLLLALACAPLQAAEVAGVPVADKVSLGGRELVLNGAGVRYRAVFKVYAAALYLPRAAATPDEALAQQGPKRISLTLLRDIDAGDLGKLFARGVQDNLERGKLVPVLPGVMRMSDVVSQYKTLSAGDVIAFDWVPGQGTTLTIRGKPAAEPFREPEFFEAVTRIWLGPKPADPALKEALLGRKPAAPTTGN